MPEWLLRLPAFAFLHSPPGFFGSALQGFDVPARRFGFGLQAPHVRLAGRPIGFAVRKGVRAACGVNDSPDRAPAAWKAQTVDSDEPRQMRNVDEAVGQDRTVLAGRRSSHGIQAPLAGHALERVHAAILKAKSGTGHEVFYGA